MNKNNTCGLSTASLVLGILSLFLGWIPVIGWILVALALIFGIVGLVKISKDKHLNGKGLSIAGIILGALGLIIAIGAMSGSTSDVSPIKEAAPVEEVVLPVAETPKVVEPTTFKIGDKIVAGDFTWKITGMDKQSEIGENIYGTFMGEKADGEFLILSVEVENTGNEAKYLMDSFVKLVDDKSREFSADTMAAIYIKPQGSALMFEVINPGIIKKGKIVFDVPKNLNLVNLRILDNLAQSSVYTVKLMS